MYVQKGHNTTRSLHNQNCGTNILLWRFFGTDFYCTYFFTLCCGDFVAEVFVEEIGVAHFLAEMFCCSDFVVHPQVTLI